MNPDDLRLLETVGAEAEVAAGHVLIGLNDASKTSTRRLWKSEA